MDCLPPIPCPGRGKNLNFSFQVTCTHNHVQMEDLQLKTHVVKVDLKQKAETTSGHISFREAFNKEIKQNDEAKGQLTFAMLEVTLRKRRKRIYPILPSLAKVIEIMKQYDGQIFIDGAFKSSPPLYDSLVTIHIKYSNNILPAAYFLMTCRTEQLYNLALKKIKEFINNEGFRPSVVMSDWEIVFHNALSN